MNKRILITSIGGMFAHDFIRALRMSKNIFLLGTDIKKTTNSYFLDSFELISDPKKNSDKYIKRLIYLCKKYRINFILPGSDNECIEISRHHKILEKMKVKTSVSEFEILKKIIDKNLLFKHLKSNNIEVGNWSIVNSINELRKISLDMGYPKKKLIIKPRTGSGSKGVIILDSKINKFVYLLSDNKRFCGTGSIKAIQDELRKKNKNLSSYLIMPYYNYKTFDVDCIAQKGNMRVCVPRLRTYQNPLSPTNEGCKIVNNKKIIHYCKKIIKVLNIDGVCDFDIILKKNQEPQIIDASCRLSGSATASLAIGINIPLTLIKLYFKEGVQKINLNKTYQVFPQNRFELVK